MSKVVELTEKLVGVESVAQKPENLNRVVEIADSFLPENLIRHRYESGGKPSLVLGFKDTKKPRVLFLAHLDVVDGKPEQFKPKIEGDRMFGRGVLDMKGPGAAAMVAFANAAQKGLEPDAAIMLTTDEEVGSEHGVNYLVNEHGWSADFVVIPDGGNDFKLIIKGKGAFHFKAFATGVAAHGSYTWAGQNAIDKLIDFYQELKPIFQLRSNDPAHWHETLNIGVIRGGKKVNIVPDSAEAHFDIRFTETWSVQKVRETVENAARKYDLKIEVESTGEPFYTRPDDQHLQEFAACVKDVLGKEPEYAHEHGATDGRFFAQHGIPVVILYPTGGNIHGDGEWVSISGLEKLTEIFSLYLERLS